MSGIPPAPFGLGASNRSSPSGALTKADFERCRQFFRYSNEANLVIDADGKILLANPKSEELTNYEASELEKLSLPEIFAESDRGPIEVLIRSTLQWHSGIDPFRHLQRKHGRKIIVDIRTSLLELENERYVICSMMDITARVKAENRAQHYMDRLTDLNAELERKNAELNTTNQWLEKLVEERSARLVQSARLASLAEMAGGIAHEVNNPLQIIKLQMNRLTKRLAPALCSSDSECASSIDSIQASIERIAKIITGLREFACGGPREPFGQVRLAQLISDVCLLCQARLTYEGIRLEVGPIEADLEIEARKAEFSQALYSLLSNAHAAVLDLPEKWIRIDVRDEGSEVLLAVTDSGSGILAEHRAKLMQPFFTTKPPGKGTGLGLSTSSGIVAAHHGTLALRESHPNTRFEIRVPKKQP